MVYLRIKKKAMVSCAFCAPRFDLQKCTKVVSPSPELASRSSPQSKNFITELAIDSLAPTLFKAKVPIL